MSTECATCPACGSTDQAEIASCSTAQAILSGKLTVEQAIANEEANFKAMISALFGNAFVIDIDGGQDTTGSDDDFLEALFGKQRADH